MPRQLSDGVWQIDLTGERVSRRGRCPHADRRGSALERERNRDVTSDGESLSPPPWYLNDDNPTIEFSIERLAERLPPVDVVASGHGEPLVGEAYRAIHTMSARQSVTGDTA